MATARRAARIVPVALVASVLLAPAIARAADDACFTSYEASQRLRKEGKLVEADEQAQICMRDVCPSMLRTDCARWRVAIARELPTVVFVAKDASSGTSAEPVTVYVDGRKVADSVDGRPVPLDPGPHTVRYESPGAKAEMNVTVAQTDRNRTIEGTLAPATPAPAPSPKSHRIPTVSWVLGGVAALGLVSFVTFAVAGHVELGCSPLCQPGQISTIHTEYAVADVSWITGLAALGGAVAFWVAQPGSPAADTGSQKTGTLRLDLRPQVGGGTLALRGTF